MLARGQKKLDRLGHDLDWQGQVYKIDVRIFRNVFKRQVMLEVLARIQAAGTPDGRFGSAAKANKAYAAFAFQPLQGRNMGHTGEPTATHKDNTDRRRHERTSKVGKNNRA